MFSFNQPSFEVVLSASTIMTDPVSMDPEDFEPSDDSILTGKIILILPKNKACSRIKVVLTGLTDLGGVGIKLQSTITLRKELVIDLKGDMIEAGEHEWIFSFIIPSLSAPSQFADFCRIRYSIVSTLEFSKNSSISSSPAPLIILQNTSARSKLLESLNSVVSASSAALGPVTATFSSPRLSVSSLVHLNINFASPPTNLSIISIQTFLSETFTLRYDKNNTSTLPPQSYALVSDKISDSNTKKEVTKLKYGFEWNHSRVLRIPGDQILHPTTLTGTDSKVFVKHQFVIVVKYKVEGKGEKEEVLVLKTHNVIVGSCQIPNDDRILPQYSKLPEILPSDAITNATKSSPKHKCFCLYSFDELRKSSVGFCISNEDIQLRGVSVECGRKEKSPASAAM